MLLGTAAILVGGGLAIWVLGRVFDAQEIAMIGAVIVLGTGVVLTGGLEIRDGQMVEKAYTTVGNNTTVVANETTTYQTRPVPLPTRLPLGALVMLAGGTAGLRALDSTG